MTEREMPPLLRRELCAFVTNKCIPFIEERDGIIADEYRYEYYIHAWERDRVVIRVDGPAFPAMWFLHRYGDTEVRELSRTETEEEKADRIDFGWNQDL